jgi:hypothetical protein
MGVGSWGKVIVVASALLLPSAAQARPRSAQCPDPTMLIERTVTLMCTGQTGFPSRSASSIAGLSRVRPHPAFAAEGWPSWADDGYWAPDLEHVGDRYLLYYSARRRTDHRHCIGLAISDRPAGGFRDIGRPLIDGEPDGAIDPALLRADGQLFLLYKRDGNSVGAPSVILGRPLSADGLHLAGPRVELLSSQSTIEAPSAIQLGEVTYLIYSEGGFATPAYAEAEAIRDGTALGRFRRLGTTPILRSDAGWVGTGGGSILVDGSRLLLAYEAFRPGRPTVRRLLFVRPLAVSAGELLPSGPAQRIPLLG